MNPSSDPFEIVPYENSYRAQLIEVWEKPVRSTHDFVTPADLEY